MHLINTGIMCMISVPNPNSKDGFKQVDLGNYFIDSTNGKKCLIASLEDAMKYGEQIDVPIYICKEQP